MTSDDVERALSVAKVRGFVVIDEPFDPDNAEHKRVLDEWSSYCETVGRNPVLVIQTGFGLWRAAIAFREGAGAEMAYVLHELREAFARHLGDSARSSDEAWFASTQHRRHAEALAFDLAAIDAEPRDPKFEDVFVVNDL